VPTVRTIDRALRRHRMLACGTGIAIVLGVMVLNAHAALPEHHHHHGEETLCAAALSIAVATGALWLARRDPDRTLLARPARLPGPILAYGVPPCGRALPRSRAGPAQLPQVLRR
jgi:hypothetical protein